MSDKPTFVLRGRIVTMQSEFNIIDDGYLAIKNGRIASIVKKENDLPTEFNNLVPINTNGTIYPGLIDLHNHFVYNVLPLWVVPKKYSNRSQWPSHPDYKSGVSKPIKDALAKYSISAKALVRYVEAKSIISGTTTGQGIRTQVNGGSKIFEGAMRNVEEPGNDELPSAGTLVPDLVISGANAEERINSFRRAINNPNRSAYFYHLSEGIDDTSRHHFFNLKDNDLINEKLVGIHSLGLQKDDLFYLANKGAKIVWSPFSNMLLYGKTLDLANVKSSKVKFSLGCDWSPTGSKNMLQELKVAYYTNNEQGNIFSNYELVQSATSGAAYVTGWDKYVGTLEEGKLADIFVVKQKYKDPYVQLIKAIEKDISLVVIDGVPRYGDKPIMQEFGTTELEEVIIGGDQKNIYLFSENSPINDIGFNASIATLKDIMQDLPNFLQRMEEETNTFMEKGMPSFQEFILQPDNEFELDFLQEYKPSEEIALFADPPIANSIEFDVPTVEGESYWNRINAQSNISSGLKEWLKNCYYAY